MKRVNISVIPQNMNAIGLAGMIDTLGLTHDKIEAAT
jgi:hypothetical protein